MGLSAGARVERWSGAYAAGMADLDVLRRARTTVDGIDALIDAAKWDGVRTVLAKEPVVGVGRLLRRVVEGANEDVGGAVVGLREELLSALKLLDTAVYANVFVGEERQLLGTKIDFDTPRLYLRDVKEALDSILEVMET